MTSVIEFKADDLRKLRYRLGWSQAEMARSLKLDLMQMAALEAGREQITGELKSSIVRILHQADSNAAQTQRTPIAEVIMKQKNLSQIHSMDCQLVDTAPLRSDGSLEFVSRPSHALRGRA